LRTSGGGEGI